MTDGKLTESECIDMGMNPAWWYGMDCEPCCGLHPRLMDTWDRGDMCYYECPSCGRRTALFNMPWQARDAWNRGEFGACQLRFGLEMIA